METLDCLSESIWGQTASSYFFPLFNVGLDKVDLDLQARLAICFAFFCPLHVAMVILEAGFSEKAFFCRPETCVDGWQDVLRDRFFSAWPTRLLVAVEAVEMRSHFLQNFFLAASAVKSKGSVYN